MLNEEIKRAGNQFWLLGFGFFGGNHVLLDERRVDVADAMQGLR